MAAKEKPRTHHQRGAVPTQVILPGEGSRVGRGERRVTGRRLVVVVLLLRRLLVHVARLQGRNPHQDTDPTFPGLRPFAPDSRDRIQGDAPHL